MICLNISLRGKEAILQLYFKKWDDAEKASLDIHKSNEAFIRDDYGQYAIIQTEEVTAAIVTDMNRYFEAQGEIGVMQAKAQQAAQNKMNAQGPRLMSPGMNNPNRFNC